MYYKLEQQGWIQIHRMVCVWMLYLVICVLLLKYINISLGQCALFRLCDNSLLDSGCRTLLEALPENRFLVHLSLMHTGLGDSGALELAEKLQQHSSLQEINVAYNSIGDGAALTLVDACREHPSIHTVQYATFLCLHILSFHSKTIIQLAFFLQAVMIGHSSQLR